MRYECLRESENGSGTERVRRAWTGIGTAKGQKEIQNVFQMSFSFFYHQRLSLLPTPSFPLNSADPEFGSSSDARSRSGSRGIVDFFRMRKKSTTNNPSLLQLPSPESKDNRSKSPMRSPQKLTRRQRSKSTAEPPDLPSELPYQWRETSEPIEVRMFNAKRSGSSFQTESQATPMSELLSKQATPGATKPPFGIEDFLQLFNSQNGSDSKRDGLRSPNRSVSLPSLTRSICSSLCILSKVAVCAVKDFIC